jgi:hypothetical protein
MTALIVDDSALSAYGADDLWHGGGRRMGVRTEHRSRRHDKESSEMDD